jgi:hypothetical protein
MQFSAGLSPAGFIFSDGNITANKFHIREPEVAGWRSEFKKANSFVVFFLPLAGLNMCY